MKEFIYTGSEQSLEGLLIWWGTLEEFEHSEGCISYTASLHCCEGVIHPNLLNYAVEATSPPWPSPREFFPINFVDCRVGFRILIVEPHMFTYDGETIKVDKA